MNRSKPEKKKVTLSLDSSSYDSFKEYCTQNAILLSKKIELWMKTEMLHPGTIKQKLGKKSRNKKVTISVNTKIYTKFQEYCEENAIMLSKKIELWMRAYE